MPGSEISADHGAFAFRAVEVGIDVRSWGKVDRDED